MTRALEDGRCQSVFWIWTAIWGRQPLPYYRWGWQRCWILFNPLGGLAACCVRRSRQLAKKESLQRQQKKKYKCTAEYIHGAYFNRVWTLMIHAASTSTTKRKQKKKRRIWNHQKRHHVRYESACAERTKILIHGRDGWRGRKWKAISKRYPPWYGLWYWLYVNSNFCAYLAGTYAPDIMCITITIIARQHEIRSKRGQNQIKNRDIQKKMKFSDST